MWKKLMSDLVLADFAKVEVLRVFIISNNYSCSTSLTPIRKSLHIICFKMVPGRKIFDCNHGCEQNNSYTNLKALKNVCHVSLITVVSLKSVKLLVGWLFWALLGVLFAMIKLWKRWLPELNIMEYNHNQVCVSSKLSFNHYSEGTKICQD